MDDDTPRDPSARRMTWRRVLLAGLALSAVAIAGVWLARKPIADTALRDILAKKGVPARYDIKSIGARWQRIENLRLGDPRNPDLIAEWVELRLSADFSGVTASAIRAGGVRLRGRLANGKLSFGAVDKLLPKGDGKTPFTLPDIDADLADARMRLDTPYGPVGARLEGKGNLRSGFIGKLAALAPTLGQQDCMAQRATAYLDISIRARKPQLTGPVRAEAVRCGGVSVVAPAMALDATMREAFDQIRGSAVVEARGMARGSAKLAGLQGKLGFDGPMRAVRGTADLSAESGRIGAHRLVGLSFDGGYALANGLSGDGTLRIDRMVPDPAIIRRFAKGAQSARGTPAGPLMPQLVRAMGGAGEGLAVTADMKLASGMVQVSRLVATGRDRLVLRAEGGEGVRFGTGGFVADTRVQLSGGGFPAIDATLQRRADGRTQGLARIAPLSAPGSKLALQPVRFAALPSGAMRFETVATLDGPLGAGRVTGLRTPVFADMTANGGIVVNRNCAPMAMRGLVLSGFALGATALTVCPMDGGGMFAFQNGRMQGGVRVENPKLTGRIGSTALSVTAGSAAYRLGTSELRASGVTARMGGGNRISTLNIGILAGRTSSGGLRGTFAGLSGKLANVPLLVSNSAGDWTFANGTLSLKGGLTVADEPVPARFQPLVSDNVALKLANGRINATATLREPTKQIEIVRVVIGHDLAKGTGSAVLDVPGIKFGKILQPEELTRLTLGVIANVEGLIAGRGNISWTPQGVTSTGRFKTDDMNLAAAFGPVSGLKGEIAFSDLLALATPPGQSVTIASINPGTLVTNGTVTYQLLPGQRIAVEHGYWPFAGGTLTLDPTILDMGRPSDRRLTFRVDALDAAKFIQTLEFENLAATGTFDGVLPMIFDASGGRIEDGRLVARAGGGTLAYVGEVSNAQMNIYGRLAFDALKSMRFQNLTIDLNGPLDGEIVSKVNFSGRNEAPLTPPKNFIARQFIGLPFKFNVTIRAPFRSLLNTARTFQDPTSLLQRTLPEMREKPVQPPESEKKQ